MEIINTKINNFPKIIHQIWIQGENNLSEEHIKKINDIKKKHLDWEYILWDEIMILKLISKTSRK